MAWGFGAGSYSLDAQNMKLGNLPLETRATLSLLVREIQDAMANAGPTGTEQYNAVKTVIDEWIEGSNLQPEKVKTIKTQKEFEEWLLET